MGISDGLGSRKLEVLADTTVTLEQGNTGEVVNEVVKKILKVLHTHKKLCTLVCMCVHLERIRKRVLGGSHQHSSLLFRLTQTTWH